MQFENLTARERVAVAQESVQLLVRQLLGNPTTGKLPKINFLPQSIRVFLVDLLAQSAVAAGGLHQRAQIQARQNLRQNVQGQIRQGRHFRDAALFFGRAGFRHFFFAQSVSNAVVTAKAGE